MTGSDVTAALVARFREGSAQGTADMYAHFGKMVYAVAWRVLGERGAAEEATQQTFVQAWRHAGELAEDRDPAPWLATIARRVAIDIARHRARRPTLVRDVEGRQPPHAVHDPGAEELWRTWRVREEIERLDPREREVVQLQHERGLSHAEIAEHLGIAIGTVKSRSFRAHRQLAAALADLRNGEPETSDRRTRGEGGGS
jgi:RNA polymerase sigma factor (sigma-70 family)